MFSMPGAITFSITETWLRNCHTNCEIAIQGYNIEIHDRAEGNGGGVAVYIHDSVSYKCRRDLETGALEALIVQVSFPHTNTCWLPQYIAHQMQQLHGIKM